MFPVATVLCAYSGTIAPARINAMKTRDTTVLTFVEVPRSMLSHPREQSECSRIKFTTLRKRYTSGFARSTGITAYRRTFLPVRGEGAGAPVRCSAMVVIGGQTQRIQVRSHQSKFLMFLERIPNCRLASGVQYISARQMIECLQDVPPLLLVPPASMVQALRRYPRSTLPDGRQCSPQEAQRILANPD
jgi:hypothetical protein